MLNVNAENKVKALQFIYTLARELYSALGISFPDTKTHDVVLDAAICNIMYNLHQARRQEFNRSTGSAKGKFEGNAGVTLEVHGRTHTYTIVNLKAYYNAAMQQVDYTKETYQEWGGTVQTLMTILTCFGERLKELRVMPVGIVTSKKKVGDTTETHVIDFKRMGVKPQHRQLCAGASFKPFVKSGIAQSLGPLCQACMLSLAGDDKFADKWVSAVNRSFAYVPEIEQVTRVMKSNRVAQNQPIVSALANIAMLAGGREQRRMTPPLSAFMHYLTVRDEEGHVTFHEESARALDFSGKGAFVFYKEIMTTVGLQFSMNVNDKAIGQQLLFHAMFGTYVEDFGVLSYMTGVTRWMRRSELNLAFQQIKASAPPNRDAKLFPLLPVTRYSKLASATLMKEAATTTQATNACPIFAGNRVRKFTNEMYSSLRATDGQARTLNTVQAVTAHLSSYTDYLLQATESRDYNAGTVSWHEIASLTHEHDGADVSDVAVETGSIYWSS